MKKKTKAQSFAKEEMHKFKHGTLHSGSKKGPVVKEKSQAVAIMLNQARKKGLKVSGKK